MEITALPGLIGSLGFPIVMCGVLMVYGKKALDTLSQNVKANTEVMLVIATKLNVDVKDHVQ